MTARTPSCETPGCGSAATATLEVELLDAGPVELHLCQPCYRAALEGARLAHRSSRTSSRCATRSCFGARERTIPVAVPGGLFTFGFCQACAGEIGAALGVHWAVWPAA